MNRVGLVLGGGGITGAAYEIAALMAIELATGWNPNDAEVVVGTSAGAFVASLVRNDALSLDSLVLPTDDREAVAERIRSHVFTRSPGADVSRWLRHGIVPGIRKPGLTMFLGSPAPYETAGLARWLTTQIGASNAARWPDRPTAIVAYDVTEAKRVSFGTTGAPEVGLAEAVAASSAIPLLFHPYEIDAHLYVDGGVASGTHADLVLGVDPPLDMVLVLAPFAATEQRSGAWFHEKMFDRVGRRTLVEEAALIKRAWRRCEIVTLRPSVHVQNSMRPNPMDAGRAVPTFIRTLSSMRRTLARAEMWSRLETHLVRSAGMTRLQAGAGG